MWYTHTGEEGDGLIWASAGSKFQPVIYSVFYELLWNIMNLWHKSIIEKSTIFCTATEVTKVLQQEGLRWDKMHGHRKIYRVTFGRIPAAGRRKRVNWLRKHHWRPSTVQREVQRWRDLLWTAGDKLSMLWTNWLSAFTSHWQSLMESTEVYYAMWMTIQIQSNGFWCCKSNTVSYYWKI